MNLSEGGLSSDVIGSHLLSSFYNMSIDADMEIDSIEIEKVVGELYPKGWKFIDQKNHKVKRV